MLIFDMDKDFLSIMHLFADLTKIHEYDKKSPPTTQQKFYQQFSMERNHQLFLYVVLDIILYLTVTIKVCKT